MAGKKRKRAPAGVRRNRKAQRRLRTAKALSKTRTFHSKKGTYKVVLVSMHVGKRKAAAKRLARIRKARRARKK